MWRIVFGTIFVFMALSFVNVPCYAFAEDIIAAWTLDEGDGNSAHDISGNANDGEIIGGAEWVDGKFDKALEFDGSTSYVEIPFADSMKIINDGEFTFVSWFMADDVTIQRNVLQQLDLGGTGRSWLYLTADTNAEIASFIGGSRTSSGINADAGEWYHGAVVVGKAGVQLYVNGVPEGEPTGNAMEPCEGAFRIGTHKTVKNVWSGIIDEVAIFGKALTQPEIQKIMTAGLASAIAPVEPVGKLAVSWGSVKDGAKR